MSQTEKYRYRRSVTHVVVYSRWGLYDSHGLFKNEDKVITS